MDTSVAVRALPISTAGTAAASRGATMAEVTESLTNINELKEIAMPKSSDSRSLKDLILLTR